MKKELIEFKKTYYSLNAVYTEAAKILEFTITLPDGSTLQTETKYSHGAIYVYSDSSTKITITK